LRHKRKARGVPTGEEKRKAQQESRSTRATTQTRTKRTKNAFGQRRRQFRTKTTTVPATNDDDSALKELYSSIPDSVRNRPPENAELSLSYARSIFLRLVTSDIFNLLFYFYFYFLNQFSDFASFVSISRGILN
jgi:hypothetical protein